MTMRVSEKTVIFRHPFILAGMDEAHPAGRYSVETSEEPLEGLSFSAYRRLATWIRLHENAAHPGVVQVLKVDPDELAAALARDAVDAGAPANSDAMPKIARAWEA